MMENTYFITLMLPFLMAYVLQLLNVVGGRQIATNILTVLQEHRFEFKGQAYNFVIDFALHFYRQVSFFLSLLLSAVSALALTLESSSSIVTLVTFLIIIEIAVWYFRWQTLGANHGDRKSRDKEMVWASFLTITIMLIITFCVQYIL